MSAAHRIDAGDNWKETTDRYVRVGDEIGFFMSTQETSASLILRKEDNVVGRALACTGLVALVSQGTPSDPFRRRD